MADSYKTKERLIKKLQIERRRVTRYKKSESKLKEVAEQFEQLKASEEKYSTLVEKGNDGVVIIQDGLLKFANARMAALTGFSLEEALGKPFADLVAPEYRELVLEVYRQRTTGGEAPVRYEIEILAKGGGKIPVEVNGNKIESEGRAADMAIVRDITERKKMQEQLMVTDRLASVGQVAAGVAHELNNPLTSVIGFSEILLKRDLPADVKKDLKTINQEALRTARVVKGLLTFARKQKAEKEPVDIGSVIQNVLQLRRYEQRLSNLEVNIRLAPELPTVWGNGGQLQQVFMNIVINAEQAMLEARSSGRLTITAERAADMVRVSFADDGPGISPENMRTLFTPFFTTKEVGKGTGLGLSICHGIITEHGGRIYAESELGKGATFVVELPVSKLK